MAVRVTSRELTMQMENEDEIENFKIPITRDFIDGMLPRINKLNVLEQKTRHQG